MNEEKLPTLGEKVKAKREELHMTQRDLAKKIGINSSTISRIESDPDVIADPKTIRGLADALHLDYMFLLSLNRTLPDQPEVRSFARATSKMNDSQKERAMQLLRENFGSLFDEGDDFDMKGQF